MWTYPDLKAADAALDPQISDPAAAAAALNQQTITLPPHSFSATSALNILLIAQEWPKVLIRSEARPLDAAGAVAAAISAVTMLQAQTTIAATDPVVWPVFTGCLAVLQAAGDISADSVAKITALRTPTVPKWEPPVTDQDVTAARALT